MIGALDDAARHHGAANKGAQIQVLPADSCVDTASAFQSMLEDCANIHAPELDLTGKVLLYRCN